MVQFIKVYVTYTQYFTEDMIMIIWELIRVPAIESSFSSCEVTAWYFSTVATL